MVRLGDPAVFRVLRQFQNPEETMTVVIGRPSGRSRRPGPNPSIRDL